MIPVIAVKLKYSVQIILLHAFNIYIYLINSYCPYQDAKTQRRYKITHPKPG